MLPPLVVTLAMDDVAQERFQSLHDRHFPAHRNQVPAHLTLFHALPGEQEASIVATLHEVCARQPLLLTATALMKLGRGVAFRVEGDGLLDVHQALRQHWMQWLTAQDRQGFRPHVVIQNKAEPADARALYAELASSFQPFSFAGTGVLLWQYLGGPWQHLHTVRFTPALD